MMMLDSDNLETNPLFRALQTDYLKLFQWVQLKRGLVCIPHTSTISRVAIDQYFVEMHILIPSPFLKDHYVRPASDKEYCVAVENDSIITLDGYPKPSRRVKILGEEPGYNEKFESFRILFIDGPLVGEKQEESGSSSPEQLKEFTVSKGRDFLARCSGGAEVIRMYEAELRQFKSTYMILSGFLDDAADRLRRIWTNVTEFCLSKLDQLAADDTVLIKNIHLAVECCVLGDMYDIIWPIVCEHSSSQDNSFVKKCNTLRENGFSPQHFTSDSFESWDFSRAQHDMDQLDKCKCPREKMALMKSVLDNLSHVSGNDRKQSGLPDRSADKSPLTSDDYISLLVLVIVRCGAKHLMSNFCYLDLFQMFSNPSDNLSFSLVTFKAASTFVSSVPAAEKKLSIDDRVEQSMCLSSQNFFESNETGINSIADTELERINRMLRTSAGIIAEVSENVTTNAVSSSVAPSASSTVVLRHNDGSSSSKLSHPSQRHAPLGDFLSSLKNDNMHVSFGRQN